MGRLENCVGWYHSHPGYSCWLSGIDVNTQKQNQMLSGVWVAVVVLFSFSVQDFGFDFSMQVDPVQTMSSGKVEIGAFRTYPDDYVPPEGSRTITQGSLPRAKIEEFGLHASEYYELDVDLFKSSVDTQLINLLWSKYWVNSLTAAPLLANRDYLTGSMVDFVDTLDSVENQVCILCC